MIEVHVEHPFAKGDLTPAGEQWSAEKDTATANIDVEVERVIIAPPALGALIELEFSLVAAFRACSSATADVVYKWQARNKGGTWVDLHDAVTLANVGTIYVEETRSGWFKPAANFDGIPFEVRLIIQCNEANEGRARINGASWVRVKYSHS